MRIHYLMYVVILMLSAACKSGSDNSKKQIAETKQVQNSNLEKGAIKKESVIDSGQVYFKVDITKNDTPYINYQGTWPLLLLSNNSATIQLSQSKKLMSISNMLTIYMHGLPTGKVPIVISNRDADKVSMVMSQVINGSYDIPILPTEGFLTVTKNTGKIFSGSFDARAVDANKNNYWLTGTFLNLGVNDDSHIK